MAKSKGFEIKVEDLQRILTALGKKRLAEYFDSNRWEAKLGKDLSKLQKKLEDVDDTKFDELKEGDDELCIELFSALEDENPVTVLFNAGSDSDSDSDGSDSDSDSDSDGSDGGSDSSDSDSDGGSDNPEPEPKPKPTRRSSKSKSSSSKSSKSKTSPSSKSKTSSRSKSSKTKTKTEPAKKKAPRTGVIHTIIAALTKATEKKPVTKEQILSQLVKAFPDRKEASMAATISVQVPGKINREREGVTVHKSDKGYWATTKK
jgi:hypothetical protein